MLTTFLKHRKGCYYYDMHAMTPGTFTDILILFWIRDMRVFVGI